MRHARTAPLAAILCLLVAGCGGGSSGSSASSSSSPAFAAFKSGYVKLRGGLNETGTAVARELVKAPQQSDAEVASAFGGLASSFGVQLTQLGALKAPPGLASAFSAAIYAAHRVDGDLHSISVAAAGHHPSAAGRATTALGRDITAMKAAAAMVKHGLGIK